MQYASVLFRDMKGGSTTNVSQLSAPNWPQAAVPFVGCQIPACASRRIVTTECGPGPRMTARAGPKSARRSVPGRPEVRRDFGPEVPKFGRNPRGEQSLAVPKFGARGTASYLKRRLLHPQT